ncbi:MAG: AEC family transporter [Limnobacter sp.]|nr:AEC family transporter [Limnobacter sp.]
MFARIVEVIFPVFALVVLGYLYARKRKPDMQVANRLNTEVFIPALIFGALASKNFELEQYGWLALGAAMVVLGSGLVAWPAARWLGVRKATFVPPMMFSNSGNMGLPLAVLAFGERALPAAVMLFFVENTLHYVLGPRMLNRSAPLSSLFREPVLIAAFLGIAVSALKVSVWGPLLYAIQMTGDVSIPLLLFALGVRLTQSRLSDFRLGVIGGILCPAAGLLFAFLAIQVLPLSGQQASMLILFGALPPAVLNFVFAERYGVEPHRVASLVMMGNLLSLVFVPLALYWVL